MGDFSVPFVYFFVLLFPDGSMDLYLIYAQLVSALAIGSSVFFKVHPHFLAYHLSGFSL